MKSEQTPQENNNDLELACTTLNRLLGTPEAITPAELVSTFGSTENISRLSKPGLEASDLCRAFRENIADAPTDPPQPNNSPDSTQLIANSVDAFWKWAHTGFGIAPPALQAARLAACNTCDRYVDAPETGLHRLASPFSKTNKICSLCGCFMEKKVRQISAKCPIEEPSHKGWSRWGEPLVVTNGR